MSTSCDVWAALTTLAATTEAQQKGDQVEAVAEAEAVEGAVAEVEATAEVEVEATAEAKAETEAEAEDVGEVEMKTDAKPDPEAPGGAACTGTHVSRTEERPACWTDFRGLVTAPLADLDPAAHLTDPASHWPWQDMSQAGDAWAALTTLAGGK